MSAGELYAQLVETVRAERGDELGRGGVHPVVEVRRPVHRVEPAPDVEGRLVLEEEIPRGELVLGGELVVRLAQEEVHTLRGGNDARDGDGGAGKAGPGRGGRGGGGDPGRGSRE